MARQSESLLSSQIRDAIEHRWPGSVTVKTVGSRYGPNGIPDILGCVEGRGLALEVKLPNNRKGMSDNQRKYIKLFEDAGAIAGEVRSVGQALALVEKGLSSKVVS